MKRSFLFLFFFIAQYAFPSPSPFQWGLIDDSPSENDSQRFQSLYQALSEDPNATLKLTSFPSLDAATKALESNQVHLLTLRPSEYLEIRKNPGMKSVAIFLYKGNPYHHSLFLSRSKTKAKSLAAFKGKRLGLGKGHSLSTYQVPLIELKKNKIDPDSFFSKLVKDLSHSKLELALVKGEVDLASGSDIVHESLLKSKKIKDSDLKIIQRSEPIPNEVLLMSQTFLNSSLGKKIKTRLSDLISKKTNLPAGTLPEPWVGLAEVPQELFDKFENQLSSP